MNFKAALQCSTVVVIQSVCVMLQQNTVSVLGALVGRMPLWAKSMQWVLQFDGVLCLHLLLVDVSPEQV